MAIHIQRNAGTAKGAHAEAGAAAFSALKEACSIEQRHLHQVRDTPCHRGLKV